eukprot:TRINITY_DN1331_c0_g1_i1.p1 TRINITY_DN1331_c0_g1~~TRINITY_DN1331_c0_g1_i1.p1  ORF type:complete len:384 (-),score=119.34 TRINITY_DN1331_c0_g1_i1:673-1719(-)
MLNASFRTLSRNSCFKRAFGSLENFKAWVIRKDETKKVTSSIESLSIDDLPEGDVVVKVNHTGLNYKDGMALTGLPGIIKPYPGVSGIDFAGIVEDSQSDKFEKGQEVVLTGWGVGENRFGGHSEFARVRSDMLVPLSKELSTEMAMGVGTAGFTGMICADAVASKIKPEDGPVLVTGASGGVGSFATMFLSQMGYKVIASTGKMNDADFLMKIGASDVIDCEQFAKDPKPLEKAEYAGAVDVVGGVPMANVLAHLKYGGVMAACGLVGSPMMAGTVMPFILRGVTLVGCDSVQYPIEKRQPLWDRIAELAPKDLLKTLYEVHPLEDALDCAHKIMDGKVKGRIVFEV